MIYDKEEGLSELVVFGYVFSFKFKKITGGEKMNKRKKGFTLIELIIVILAIAFILAIFVALFSKPLKQMSVGSAVEKVSNDMRQISDAWQRLYVEKGIATTNITDLKDQGVLSDIPLPPSRAKADNYNGTFAYTIAQVDTNKYAIDLDGVSNDVCTEITNMKNEGRTDLACNNGTVSKVVTK